MKTVIEVDQEFLCRLESNIQAIRQGMEKMSLVTPQAYLSPNEFCAQIKSSRWKVNMLLRTGVLKYKKIGRKIYIPQDQVGKYFAGELTLD
jgi:hypothetical protein